MEKNEATEINDVAPSSLSHLIGQRGVIDQVRVAIDAAQMDNKKFDHALLVGPPGMGKSALAAVIAQEMATDFHEVLGQSIKNNADLNVLLLAAKDKDIVHIDECHELAKEFQTGSISRGRQAEAHHPRRKDADDVAAGRFLPLAQHNR